jgi:hypothetical protein
MSCFDENTVDIYIPRMLGNVNEDYVKKSFKKMNIGEVVYIDMHRKINENKNPYYFAFLTIKLLNTENAKYFMKVLNTIGMMKIIYDDSKNNYWEIKKYVTRSFRKKQKSRLLYPTSFTLQDHIDMIIEYDEIAKEIFAICCA